MKSQNKYYTPDITEFHVGFEYEEKDKEWKSKVFDGYTSLIEKSFCGDYGNWYDSLEEYIKAGWIRVKYLDKEDIESLGFKLTQNLQDDYEFEYHIESKKGVVLGMFIDEYDLDKEANIELFNTHFKVKNKSELKRLLKQLNI